MSRITLAPTRRGRAIALASMMYEVRNKTCEIATTAVDSSIASITVPPDDREISLAGDDAQLEAARLLGAVQVDH